MSRSLERPGASQVVTYAQDFTRPWWLGTLGHVSALRYSYACPGGCNQLSATLEVTARLRTGALDPGRWVRVYRGASKIWEGKLDEPQPGPAGWSLTAHGAGTFGGDFAATYSGAWHTSVVDDAVNSAIGRGLAWVNPGIGNPAGLWVGQPVDSGAQQVTDLLNLGCTKGGLTWYVACRPEGNVLSVFPLPTRVTHLLVVTDPAPRTLGGDINAIYLRYQTAADAAATPATFDTTSVTDQPSIAKYGRSETFTDLSSAQVLSAAAAQAVGNAILTRYQRASFAGPFAVPPGGLLTTGGAAADIGAGMPYAPFVCRALLLDLGYGGEVTPAPVTFLAGGYEFDDDTQTAIVTPFQALRANFAGLLQAITSTEPVRKVVATTTTTATRVPRAG